MTVGELEALLADLPAEPAVEIVGTRAPEQLTNVFGDIKVAGGSAPRRATTVFGDVRIDLRALRTDADRVELFLGSVFGDVEVIVAEGVDAELYGWTVFGDRKVELERGAPSAGDAADRRPRAHGVRGPPAAQPRAG